MKDNRSSTKCSGNDPSKIYEIKYACGHTAIRVKSQHDGRDAMLTKAAARNICQTCLTGQEARRERIISNSIRSAKDTTTGTKLIGSENQIKYAADIREGWLRTVRRDLSGYYLESISKKAKSIGALTVATEQGITNVLIARLAAIDAVLARSEAAWWIDSWKNGILDWIVSSRTEESIKSELSTLATSAPSMSQK